MIKFAALAATLTVFSLPAAAEAHAPGVSSVVRITVAGKSAEVLGSEIKAAAETVCDGPDSSKNGCVNVAIRDANAQLRTLRAHGARGSVDVARNDPTAVRISLKGKSVGQIGDDIDIAARTVCKASAGRASGPIFGACFSVSVTDAKLRLAELPPTRQLASN